MAKATTGASRKSSAASGKKKTSQIDPCLELLVLIDTFLSDAKCAQDMFDMVIPALKDQDQEVSKQIGKSIDLIRKNPGSDGPQRTKLVRHTRALLKNILKLSRSEAMFRGNALVGLVSRYDEFLSSLLINAYRKNPGRATSSDRSVTYEEILTLNSLNNVVDLFIAKDIEGLLRESHEYQIKTIDKEFKIGIEESFSEYAAFVEIMERRNLLVHAGGKASKYYLKKCKDIGYVETNAPSEGDVLGVSQEYFNKSILTLSDIVIRIGFSMACRIYPDKIEDIHSHLLSNIGFSLLMDEEWDLSYRLFSFALSWPEKYIVDESCRRLYAVNASISLNHLNRHKEAVELLDRYDWSTQSTDFLLAVAVIRHRWTEAEKIMSGMNGEKPFNEDEFRYWPIFNEFRRTREFRRAYKAIYGKRFVVRLSQEDRDALKKATNPS